MRLFDPRMKKLADLIVGYSTKVKPGDVVLIETTDVAEEMVSALVRSVYEHGGHPLLNIRLNSVLRDYYNGATDEGMKVYGEVELDAMMRAQVFIDVRGYYNIAEHMDVPRDRMARVIKYWWKPVHVDWRINKTRWVVLGWPSPAQAQVAEMSSEAFEDFFFDASTLDYARMSKAMDPLVELMKKTHQVHITGPGTDLRFSIKGIPAIKCDGSINIPDGEVYTAPVRDSVEGTIQYNTRSLYQGRIFDNIRFKFRNGKIVEASSSDTATTNSILDSDEGARYVGEFAFGLNPYIRRPMLNVLFDEKIAGSIHFTPGNSYEDAPNGNKSSVHWDIVLMQDQKAGGGNVYFDNVLVRKDGAFVLDELKDLNPERLVPSER